MAIDLEASLWNIGGFWAAIIFSTVLEVSGDVCLKLWAKEYAGRYLAGGLTLYTLGVFVWAQSLRFSTLARAVSVIVVVNMIAASALGAWFFHEKLTLAGKWGVALGVLSVLLLELGSRDAMGGR